jgi:hypothetical protein
MRLLYFAFGVVCTAIVIWFFNPEFEAKISPSDLFDSLVTLLVGLIITRKVAEAQNQAAERLATQQHIAQQDSANTRVEKNIVIEQLQKHLVTTEKVFEIVEQHRFKSLSEPIRQEVTSTLSNLSSNLNIIIETLQDYQLSISFETLEVLRQQQHSFRKIVTGGSFDTYSTDQYLEVQKQYRSLARAIRQLIHTVNVL